MIRKLMASCAVLALIGTGVLTAAQAEDTPAKPAVVQQDATAAEPATTELTESSAALTPDRPTLVSVFIGGSVYSSEDPESDSIGEINDLVVNEEGSITHAIVGVGGFLGIGEKDVAVPFDELKVVEEDGNVRLIYAATREQLEAAPALDRTAYRRLEHPADQEAAENIQPAAEPADSAEQQAATAETQQPAAEAAKPAEQVAAAENTGATAPDVTFLSLDKDQVWATSLIGKPLYGPEDESIGEISDLVMQEDGETRVALIDVGGFLGIGEKTVAIPFEEIKVEKGTEADAEPKLMVAMTKDQLETLPEVETDTAAADPAVDPNTDTEQGSNQAAEPVTEEAPATTGSVSSEYQPVTQNIPAGQLIGATVYGPDDSTIGEIGEVILDPKGAIKAVELDVGGFLGIGEKPVAVSFDALRVRTDESGELFVMINATKEQLEKAPTYKVSEAQ
jgi:sporulation protein YlmC with PRC-barrel domain